MIFIIFYNSVYSVYVFPVVITHTSPYLDRCSNRGAEGGSKTPTITPLSFAAGSWERDSDSLQFIGNNGKQDKENDRVTWYTVEPLS